MMNLYFSHFPTWLPLAQISVQNQPEEYHYSIYFVFHWHKQLLSNICTWCKENGPSLFGGAVIFSITILFCLALSFLIRKIVIPCLEKKHPNIAKEVKQVSLPFVWLIFWIGFSISIHVISFSHEILWIFDKFFYVCFMLSILSIIRRTLQCASSVLIVKFKKKDPVNYNMNKLILDLSMSIINLLLWIFVILFILQEVLHMKVTPLIASAGIMGLAIAFAAKDTISNIFGAFSILFSKTFKVGDGIKAGSTEGVVEKIGFRSIKIRSLNDGRLIDIPNHIIADSQIENCSARLYWREYFCFGLVYKTTPEQMTLAKKILSDIGKDLSSLMLENKPIQFDFSLFDQSSLNLDGYVWFKPSDSLTMRRARGLFNEEVLKRFQKAGIEIAFPTTTVCLENPEKKA